MDFQERTDRRFIMKRIMGTVTAVILLIISGLFTYGNAEAPATPTDMGEAILRYSVYYHETEETEPVKHQEAQAGIGLKALSVKELGFQETDRAFLGWRVFLEDGRRYLMETVQGTRKWCEVAENAGEYSFVYLQPGEVFDEEVADGAKVHFYAQWKPVIRPEDISIWLYRFCEDENPGIGSEIIFTAEVAGCDPAYYILQWQTSADNENWSDVPDATDAEYRVIVDEKNAQYYVRVLLNILD